MNFNQIVSTKTNYDLNDNIISYSVEFIEIEFINLIALLFLFSIPFLLIRFFRRFK